MIAGEYRPLANRVSLDIVECARCFVQGLKIIRVNKNYSISLVDTTTQSLTLQVSRLCQSEGILNWPIKININCQQPITVVVNFPLLPYIFLFINWKIDFLFTITLILKLEKSWSMASVNRKYKNLKTKIIISRKKNPWEIWFIHSTGKNLNLSFFSFVDLFLFFQFLRYMN